MQTAPPRCSSSLSFSLPNDYKYFTSLINNFRDDIQTPPKGSHLLRAFSPKNHFIPKYSFQTWPIYRTHPYELPNLNEHKLASHPIYRNVSIFFVNKLTMFSLYRVDIFWFGCNQSRHQESWGARTSKCSQHANLCLGEVCVIQTTSTSIWLRTQQTLHN